MARYLYRVEERGCEREVRSSNLAVSLVADTVLGDAALVHDLSAVALVVVARKRATHYFIMWTMSALYYGFSMPFAVPVTVARELIYGQLPLPRERYIAHWNNYAWRSGQPHRSLPPLSKRRELFPHFLWIFRAFVLSSRFEPMTRRESVSVLIDAGS